MNTYTLFWLTGDREIVKGTDPADAMNRSGYGNGALRALDFFSRGDDKEYTWDTENKKWSK